MVIATPAALKENLNLLSQSDLEAARKIDREAFSDQICQNAFNWSIPQKDWWENNYQGSAQEKINKIYGDPFKAIFVSSDNDVDTKFEMLKIFSDLICGEKTMNKLWIYREAINYLSKSTTKDAKQLIEKIEKECNQLREHLCVSAFEALGADSAKAFSNLYQLNSLSYLIPGHVMVHTVNAGGGAYDAHTDYGPEYERKYFTPKDYHQGDAKKIFLNWASEKQYNVLEKIFGNGERNVNSCINMLNSYSNGLNLTLTEHVQLMQDAIAYVSGKPQFQGFAPALSNAVSSNINLNANLTKLYRMIELIEWLCVHGAIRIEGYEVVGSALKPSGAGTPNGTIKLMEKELSHNALKDLTGLVNGLNYADMLKMKNKVASNNAQGTSWKPFEPNELDTMIRVSGKMDDVSAQLNRKFSANQETDTLFGRSFKNAVYSVVTRVGPSTKELETKWAELREAKYLLYAADLDAKIEEDWEKVLPAEQEYQKLCRLVDWINWLGDKGAVTIPEVNNNNQPVASDSRNVDSKNVELANLRGDGLVDCGASADSKVNLSEALKQLLQGLNYQEMSDLKDNYVNLEAHSDTLEKIDNITQHLDKLSINAGKLSNQAGKLTSQAAMVSGVSSESSHSQKWAELSEKKYPLPSGSSARLESGAGSINNNKRL